MTDRKFKTIAVSLTTLAIVVMIATIGVWAAVQTTVGVSTQISFTATGVKGEFGAKLTGNYLTSSDHTLNNVDISYAHTNAGHAIIETIDMGLQYTYMGEWDYGGNVSPSSMQLKFSFYDHDDDGSAIDESVKLELVFVNTGNYDFVVSALVSGTSSNMSASLYCWQSNVPLSQTLSETFATTDTVIVRANASLDLRRPGYLDIDFTPLVNTTFTNDSYISISITISKYVAS